MSSNRRGFTLIELLVVISIMALLMGILMPTLQRARKSARAVACQAHLRQWGLILKLYADDNSGNFFKPEMNAAFFQTLAPFYTNKEILLCMDAQRAATATGTEPGGKSSWFGSTYKSYSFGGYEGSYGISSWIIYEPGEGPGAWGADRKLRWGTPYVKNADRIPMIADCTWPALHAYQTDEPSPWEDPPGGGERMQRFCINRHNGGVNVAFMDFSTRKVGLKELWRLEWHRGYDDHAAPPVWPDWMRSFKDY